MILESAYKQDNRGKFIKEDPEAYTNINYALADLDAVSSYPSDTLAANVSKDTTSRELIFIEGFKKEDFLKQNINLFFGKVNAVEYCNEMLNFPYLEDLSNKFKKGIQAMVFSDYITIGVFILCAIIVSPIIIEPIVTLIEKMNKKS